MDLRTRIVHLSSVAPRRATHPDPRIARLRAMIREKEKQPGSQRRRDPAADRPHPAPPPLGDAHATPHGPLHVVARQLEPDHAHGRVGVRDALAVDPTVLALLALDRGLRDCDVSRMLVLDTETTGLNGGAGTLAFLVGLAWFEDGSLRIEQLFLRDLGSETALLCRVAERIAAASVLVTYNGKAFDWPLLRTRFVLQRVAAPPPPPHLDLLHCARRLLRGRLDGLRLADVERGLLGHFREDDVDGSEIPGIYLRWLRGADPETLLPVLAHNADDLVALPALLGALGARLGRVRPEDDPRDQLASARLALRARDLERALVFARAALAGGAEGDVRCEAHTLVARIAQRSGRVDDAAIAWHEAALAATGPVAASAAHLALAKLYEHAFRDLVRAELHARETEPAEGANAQARRRERLLCRIARSVAGRSV